jgi:hypothetical protein
MNLFQWFGRSDRASAQTKSERVIRRVVRLFDLPTMEVETGLWCVAAERRNTYRVSLFLWAKEEKLHCMAGCELSIERDFIPRELLLVLLEENHRLDSGSFRLVPRDERDLVVLGQVIDTRTIPESDLLPLGKALIERLQQMVCKLYAMDLIISGTEPDEARSRRP